MFHVLANEHIFDYAKHVISSQVLLVFFLKIHLQWIETFPS
jgi:hypothetical protein